MLAIFRRPDDGDSLFQRNHVFALGNAPPAETVGGALAACGSGAVEADAFGANRGHLLAPQAVQGLFAG